MLERVFKLKVYSLSFRRPLLSLFCFEIRLPAGVEELEYASSGSAESNRLLRDRL